MQKSKLQDANQQFEQKRIYQYATREVSLPLSNNGRYNSQEHIKKAPK